MSYTAEARFGDHTENLTVTDASIRRSLGFDPAEEYKYNKRRGLAVIFNQEHFNDGRVRHGTNVDRDNLENRLKELNFQVKVYNDSTKANVLKEIHEAAEADHSDADCFLLVFLSHGENNHVSAYDDKIDIRDITSMFKGDKCKSLVGKPKIFILQACRGNKFDDPVEACAGCRRVKDEVVEETGAIQTLPAGADFIMCYSTAEGYVSIRDTKHGSWYIQDLCELLQYGEFIEFTDLLTLVTRKVSMRSVGNSSDRNAIGKKQVPCFASMLRKKLYFRPKK
ncbi:caspase-6-like [Symphorus nematophorus]